MNPNQTDSSGAIDEASICGKFGWQVLEKDSFPYIFRAGVKYCAVRIVQMKALKNYLSCFRQDIYNCTCIRSYYVTAHESNLLNKINWEHSDNEFGRKYFTESDLIVEVSDVLEFHKFLSCCNTWIANGVTETFGGIGFILINESFPIPYIKRNGEKCVPMLYFEGEIAHLRKCYSKLEGWDLSYLKLFCKLHGLEGEIFAHDSCTVISLNIIKTYFPYGTEFEDYWPNQISEDSKLLMRGKTRNEPKIVQWVRQPIVAPTTRSVGSSTMNSAEGHRFQMSRQVRIYRQAQRRNAPSDVRSTHAVGNRQMQSVNCNVNYPQQPPPLVPISQTSRNNSTLPQSSSSSAVREQLIVRSNSTRPESSSSSTVGEQRIVRGNSTRPQSWSSTTVGEQRRVSGNSTRPQSSSSTTVKKQRTVSSYRMCLDHIDVTGILQIPEFPGINNDPLYKMLRTFVHNKYMTCINMRPNIYDDNLMVTVADLRLNFFQNVPLHACRHFLEVQGIGLYKPNISQTMVLVENGKCKNILEVVPLVKVQSFMDIFPV